MAGQKRFFAPFGLIAPNPTKRQTCQWFVNSSVSVTVPPPKKIALYLPWLNFDGPPKSEKYNFQIVKS